MNNNRFPLEIILSWLLLLSLAETGNATDRVLIFGDSWSALGSLSLQRAFDANAPGNDVVNAAVLGLEASELNSLDPSVGLPFITSAVANNPTADLVHLSLGGNDLRARFNPSLTLAQEDALLTEIADDIEAVVSHIVSQRPDIEVFYSSYDYLRPVPGLGTALAVNTVLEDLQSRMETRLASIPRATTHSFYGLMQTLFGQSEFGLSPGDPSLPDINLPGPPEAFADEIHFTFFGADPLGYDLFANEQYKVFYKSRLIPEPSTLVIGAIAIAGMLLRRRRRAIYSI